MLAVLWPHRFLRDHPGLPVNTMPQLSGLHAREPERRAELKRQWYEICPALYQRTDPNHPAINQELLANLLEWDPKTADGKGIGLHGPTGGCKTRMMYLLLRKVLYSDTEVQAIRAVDLSRACWEMFGDDVIGRKAREALQNMRHAQVLLIDDLGKERFTDRAESELFSLIDDRMMHQKPTLWTSNARSRSDLRNLMSGNRGEAMMRRLTEFSTVYFVSRPLYERAKPIEQLATKSA